MRLLLALLFLLVGASSGLAQSRSCHLLENEYTERQAQGGFTVVYIKGPLLVRCAGGAEIRASEATYHERIQEIHLSGDVNYQDPERSLRSDRATYSSVSGRLHATGNVHFADRVEGMTLRGPELEYFRVIPGRPESQTIATQRPHVVLQPRDSAGGNGEPTDVDADRVTMIGNDRVSAYGNVIVHRSDLDATADEGHFQKLGERLELRGRANVRGDRFTLSGDRIESRFPGGSPEWVMAHQDARLVGEDLRIAAPHLKVVFAGDKIQRLSAWRERTTSNGARPVATSRDFRLSADSLEAITPDQSLESVIAIGNARGESLDTLQASAERAVPEGESASLGEEDWILGDTITGFFASIRPEGTDSAQIQLQRIVSEGSARSLYRVQNGENGRGDRPGLNYLSGQVIQLSFSGGELEEAHVTGLKQGVYLDPVTPRSVPPATAPSGATPQPPERP